MQFRKLSRTYAALIISAGLLGLLAGVGYACLNPRVPLDDNWSSQYYFDTARGEYQINTLLNVRGREIFSSSIISDASGKAVAARSERLEFDDSDHAAQAGLYSLKVSDGKQFLNTDDVGIVDRPAFSSVIHPRFYMLDCNNFVVDMEPAPSLNYSAIFRRVTPLHCRDA